MDYKFIFFLIFYSFPAYAYLDPGTGSFILQAIIGSIAAIGTGIVFYKDKFINFFKNKKNKKKKNKKNI